MVVHDPLVKDNTVTSKLLTNEELLIHGMDIDTQLYSVNSNGLLKYLQKKKTSIVLTGLHVKYSTEYRHEILSSMSD